MIAVTQWPSHVVDCSRRPQSGRPSSEISRGQKPVTTRCSTAIRACYSLRIPICSFTSSTCVTLMRVQASARQLRCRMDTDQPDSAEGRHTARSQLPPSVAYLPRLRRQSEAGDRRQTRFLRPSGGEKHQRRLRSPDAQRRNRLHQAEAVHGSERFRLP